VAVVLSADPADVTAEWILLLPAGSPVVFLPSSLHLGLDPVVGIQVDDGFVGSFHVVLRKLAVVVAAFLCDVVLPIGLLKKQVSGVGIIPQDLLD